MLKMCINEAGPEQSLVLFYSKDWYVHAPAEDSYIVCVALFSMKMEKNIAFAADILIFFRCIKSPK